MKTICDPCHALAHGIARIREEFQLPAAFPPDVRAAAQENARRPLTDHTDRTDRHFVTLDPASSTDLDQAFAIEREGENILLHYAIADIGWFVRDGDPVEREAWERGTSQYLPDGKVSLYPPVLGEAAASLLPDGPRPAVIFTSRIAADGSVRLHGIERAVILSRAKLAYSAVQPDDLPPAFPELVRRLRMAEDRRGASRVDPPEQEVEPCGEGRYRLRFRQRYESEGQNALLSLATNMAVADYLRAHQTGLFRVMPEPDAKAIARLRQTARAFGLTWPCMASLQQYERSLDPHDPKQAAFMLAIRRAGERASYRPYEAGVAPWHAAIAGSYAHATAPLRRLADRYVIEAALALSRGQAVPEAVTDAFTRLPRIMARADSLGGRIENAIIDLAETVMMQDKVGETFAALVTDANDSKARIQLSEHPIVAKISLPDAVPGDELMLRLEEVDIGERRLMFAPKSAELGTSRGSGSPRTRAKAE